MFADFLSDSPWDNRSRRNWTTLGSFAMLTLFLSVISILPLLYVEGLPQLALLSPLVVLSPQQNQRRFRTVDR